MIMKMKYLVPVLAAVAIAPFAVCQEPVKTADGIEKTSAAELAVPAEQKPVEITPEQRELFLRGLGWLIGQQSGLIQELGLSAEDVPAVTDGFKLALLGGGKDIPEKIMALDAAYGQFVRDLQANAARVEAEKQAAIAATNKDAGAAFVKKTLNEDTEFAALPSGVLVKIISAGDSAKKPTLADTVAVRYTGKLIDGTIFDSSNRDEKTGEPKAFVPGEGETAELPLGALIPAWQEAIPQLGEGGRATIITPSDKAYGDRSVGEIPAGSTLVFDIELVKILPQESPAVPATEAVPVEAK